MVVRDGKNLRPGIRRAFRILKDVRGQAMTEYVILTAVMVGLAAYLYNQNNGIFQAFRKTYDKTALIVRLPGP